MSKAPTLLQALTPSDSGNSAEGKALLAEIDASCRRPVLFMFGNSLLWLFAGTVFALVASYKMHAPDFLTEWGWLTFGRVRPAHLNAMVYGFASQAALGVAIWLLCRLCRVPFMQVGLVLVATVFWNVGVTIGVIGVLTGDSTSIEWLEMPTYAGGVLFVAYALIAIWAVIIFRYRRERHLYVSQWYVLAALFWFPWLYAAANLMLLVIPVRGTVQAAVNWWFAHNVLGLWFTPIGLAAIYYFIPKVIGRPIHSYFLSILGFWSLALFYNWAGIHHLIGGPMPAWLITVSVVASVMMVIPVVTVAINHHLTIVGHFHTLKHSPTLRFIVFGAMSYTVVSLQGSSMAIRSLSEVTHFTHYTIAHAHIGVYAFFTVVMFGSMYYIVPRLAQREWPSARLISVHFWCVAIGIILYVVPLSVGGVLQGLALNDPDVPFLKIVALTKPYLVTRSLAGVLLTVGHLAFIGNFVWLLARRGQAYSPPVPFIAAGLGPTPLAASAAGHAGGAMNYGPALFAGIFATVAASWIGLTVVPNLQYGGLAPARIEETDTLYPQIDTGSAIRGAEVYRANGCVYCHSQQVRPEGFGADIARGWGQRRSVSRDYINQKTVFLGTMRTGPDLTNIGARQTSRTWHMNHLYNPQSTSAGSNMPAFPFLFEVRQVGSNAQPSPDALQLGDGFAPPAGYEIVPTTDAKDLVAYLLSLRADTALPEAPLGK